MLQSGHPYQQARGTSFFLGFRRMRELFVSRNLLLHFIRMQPLASMFLNARWFSCRLLLLLLLLLTDLHEGESSRPRAQGAPGTDRMEQARQLRKVPACTFPAIFNFGDSNSDTGGLAAAFGTLPEPYGITFFHSPSSGRYSDGRLVIDFIAEELEVPYLDAYLQSVGSNFQRGANFATAGSTIRVLNTTSYSPFALGYQVSQFKEFKQRALTYHTKEPFTDLLPQPQYFEGALYVVDIGQNDLTAGYFLNLTDNEVPDYIPQVLLEFSDRLKDLHDTGARKFLIITTGPLGCLPYILTGLPYSKGDLDKQGCAEPYNKVARVFNQELRATIHNLQQQLGNATFVVADGYNLKYNLFVNAHKEGFQSTTRACCGYGGGPYNFNTTVTIGFCGSKTPYNLCKDPSAYINWDGVHYTEAANRVVAEGLFSGNFTTPMFAPGHFCGLFPR